MEESVYIICKSCKIGGYDLCPDCAGGGGYSIPKPNELTQDENFWNGCKSCINYEILIAKEKKNCLCTAMLYEPKVALIPNEENHEKSSFSL